MANILIYGTDPLTTQRLVNPLRKEGHSVKICETIDLQGNPPQEASLVVLDARLKWSACRPLFETCRKLGCSVLFVTANRRMVSHLKALYVGASDVLSLPFSLKQLLGKVSALLGNEEPLRDLTVDEKEQVALLDGERVELTAQEYALLLALMENADMPVSREQLLRKAWGYQSMGDTRTVDVHVQRLRKKLGDERIETVYKCGYRLKMA